MTSENAPRHSVSGAPSEDVWVMQGALAGEHVSIAAYRLAGASGLLEQEAIASASFSAAARSAER